MSVKLSPRFVASEPRPLCRLWGGSVACLVVGQTVATFLVPRSFSLTFINDVIQLLLILSALLIFSLNATKSLQQARLLWGLLAVGWGIRVVSQMIWMYFDLVLRKEAPNPFVGDILLFLSNIPVLAALLWQPNVDRAEVRKSTNTVDFFLLLIWWLYLYLFFVIPWQYVILDEAKYGWYFNRLSACVSVALLLIAGFLWKHSTAPWGWFYGSFFVAQLLLAASAYVANQSLDRHNYYPGSLYDLPYSVALAAMTVAGLIGRNLIRISPTVREDATPLPVVKLGVLAVLSLPLITALTVLNPDTPLAVSRFRQMVVQVTVFVMTCLLFRRQQQLRTALAKANQLFKEASLTDPLTGASNRRFFDATISSDASQILRSHVSPQQGTASDLIFYMVDLDSFKEVNDRYGHNAGDLVLREVAKRITSVIRSSDTLIRWGGDEFLIVSRYANRADAASFASRILMAVGGANVALLGDHIELHQTCSVGWAAFPWRPREPYSTSLESVLALADQGVYEAKTAGRNRAIGVSPSDESSLFYVAAAGDRAGRYSVRTDCLMGPPNPLLSETRYLQACAALPTTAAAEDTPASDTSRGIGNRYTHVSETESVCVYCSEIFRTSTSISLRIAEEVHADFCVHR